MVHDIPGKCERPEKTDQDFSRRLSWTVGAAISESLNSRLFGIEFMCTQKLYVTHHKLMYLFKFILALYP